MSNWALSWHHRALEIADLWLNGIDGRDVTVAVLDTGLAAPRGLDRPDFEYLDSSGNAIGPDDFDGHGTHCASVIASYMGGALGIAPRAKLVSFKVLGTPDPTADVERALSFILSNRPDIDILSCSFVMTEANENVRNAVVGLSNAGKLVIAAAGDTPNASAFPDETERTITAAAIDSQKRPLPSARVASWIDIAAPGVDIPALGPLSGTVFGFSESSAAAAVLSGVAALVLSSRPPADRSQLAADFDRLMKDTALAVPGAPAGSVGAGIIHPKAILAAAGS